MKTIAVQVPDEVYEACQQMAHKLGRTLEECVMEFALKYGTKSSPRLSDAQRRAARERLRRHAGAQSLGHPTGADNERIDADLAREYESSHEGRA